MWFLFPLALLLAAGVGAAIEEEEQERKRARLALRDYVRAFAADNPGIDPGTLASWAMTQEHPEEDVLAAIRDLIDGGEIRVTREGRVVPAKR